MKISQALLISGRRGSHVGKSMKSLSVNSSWKIKEVRFS